MDKKSLEDELEGMSSTGFVVLRAGLAFCNAIGVGLHWAPQ